MPELPILQELVIIFGVAVVVVALLTQLGIPSLAGYIVAGGLIGPGALGLVADVSQVEMLAEVGVVLLLFGVGLELSLERMRRFWKALVIGGALQVGLTIAVVLLVSLLLGYPLRKGTMLGFLLAPSSTAIVLRGLAVRGELDAPHGRFTLGVLVFQDLCVVPMILALPLLVERRAVPVWAPALALLEALALLAFVLLVAWLLIPRLLHLIARTRRRDLFVLTVLLVCLGIAWVASRVGVSLALGAFLAGLAVAGSEYRHQALSDVIPLREVLSSIFFISVGMLFDVQSALRGLLPVLGLLVLIVAGKSSLVFLTAVLMRMPLRVGVLASAALAQVGEFSFVLARAAQGTDLLPQPLAGYLTMATILSMLATPFALALGSRLAGGVGRLNRLNRLLGPRAPAEQLTETPRQPHVIIAGYGLAGEELARALKASNIPYVVADLNSENVRRAVQRREPAYFGDVTRAEVLEHLGIGEASTLVLVINDPSAAERAVGTARRIAPAVPILVRTSYIAQVTRLTEAGASQVIVAELEAGATIVACVLRQHGVDAEAVETLLDEIRERYTAASCP